MVERSAPAGRGSDAPAALALVGPTASGKTALSLRLARALDAEIVSLDSRQVYRGLDIGTAKATAAERAAVPHHGLDLIEPDQRYSAGRFARDARGWIREIERRGRTPLLVGGTGFFLRALTQPLFREPSLDAARRARLDAWLRRQPDADLRRALEALDPHAAGALRDWGGRQRVMRALEMVLLTGRTLAWWHERQPPQAPAVPVATFVLQLPRAALYRRIDARASAMLDAGLVQEVAGLLAAGYREDDPGMNATGYREIAAHLRGECGLDEAVDAIRRATRRYARRQLTWFRNQLDADAVWLDALRPAGELAAEIAAEWHARRNALPSTTA